ncbi:MAG: translocation/assembly module TamB domain-containing protein [Caulobacterales bacterium]|nr:translocation/assembly module TamB domain-containing protein [Caulobacterales bacterium]MCA0371677.1 translocation/assembly module TamB domain-containing protein [Pseudomonadota bacterium]
MRTFAAKISRAIISAYERATEAVKLKFAKKEQTEQTPEDIAEQKKLHRHRIRIIHKHLVQAIGSASAFLMFFIIAGTGAITAARFFAPTIKGQEFIQEHIDGAKLGNAGILHVKGFRGDIFTKFTADSFSLSDKNGVWIDGKNINVDWNPISLFIRKVHISSASASLITIYRKPEFEKSKRKLSISMEIDKIITPIETKADFSVKPGLWGSAFSLEIRRNHDIKIDGALLNARRNGDRALFHVFLREKHPFEVDIDAQEANGGSLSGMLGLNANLPLIVKAKIYASVKKGNVDIYGQNGNAQFAKFNGAWNENGGKIDGNANLRASKYTHFIANAFGDNTKLNSNWSKKSNQLLGGTSSLQNLNIEMVGNQSLARLNGLVDFEARKTSGPIKAALKIGNLGALIGAKNINLGNFSFDGFLTGAIKDINLVGNYAINNIAINKVAYNRLDGDLKFKFANNSIDGDINLEAFGRQNDEILSQLFGTNPKAELGIIIKNSDLVLKNIKLRGNAIKVDAKGGMGFLGQSQFSGSAEVGALAVTKNALSGAFVGTFNARQINNSTGFIFDLKAHGEKLATKLDVVNHFLGNSPKLDGQLSISPQGLDFNSFKLYGNDVVFDGKGNGRPNPFADLSGKVQLGPKFLEIFKIHTSASGTFQFLGLGTNDGFKLKADLNGKNFSTDVEILNKYFTQTPRISGTLLLQPHNVVLENGNLVSSQIKANLGGQLAGKEGFILNGNWQMLVPFYLGGFEVSGNPSGTGSIIGPEKGPIINVNSKLNQLNFQDFAVKNANVNATINLAQHPIATEITLLGSTDFGPIQGKAKISGNENSTEISNITLNGAGINALGSANFVKNKPPVADFAFVIGKGLILRDGQLKGGLRITKIGNDTFAKVNANGQNFAIQGQDLYFTNLSINGEGKLENLSLATQFSTSGALPINFNGRTNFKHVGMFSTISISGSGNALGRNYITQTPIEFLFSERKTKGRGSLAISPGQNQEAGYLDFDLDQAGDEFTTNAKMRNINLAILQRDFAGNFSGQMQLHGKNGQLDGSLDGDVNGARPKGLSAQMGLDGKIISKLQNNIMQLDINAKNAQGLKIDANVNLPTISSSAPLRLAIDTRAQMVGHVKINGEVRPLTDLIFAGERTLNGNIDFESDLAGSIANPQLNGKMSIANGNFREPRIGLSLTQLNIDSAIVNDKILISQLKSKDKNGGELSGQGAISFSKLSNSNFDIYARKFRLIDSDVAHVDVSGAVKIESNDAQIGKMSGDLKIDYAEFSPHALSANHVASLDVTEINLPASRQIVSQNSQAKNSNLKIPEFALDVNLRANNGVFIRGRGLNLELSLNSHVGGTLAKPDLNGTAKVYRGEYEYGGRSFEFADRGTITLATTPNNIRLNLEATRVANNITAKIEVKGTAAHPLIELTSVPNLPKDEILAQVLFGRARSQLSPVETVELATSLAALAGGGGFDVIGNLREIVRLDRLVFANTASGEISIAGGKYLSRQVYIELISEGTQGISTNVEWRPKPSTAIISKVGASGDSKISIRWRHEIK